MIVVIAASAPAAQSKNLKKLNKFFSKEYKPYVIGKISKGKNKVKINGSINWLQ